jgi:hypothetical protein
MLAALVAGVVIGGGTSASFAAGMAATPAAAPAPTVAAAVAAARCCHHAVPGNYVYNPNTTYQRTLHDYCSYSPDEFPAPGTNANFRGPCAKHDMCYQYHQKSQVGCDNQLLTHLDQECNYTYAWYDPRFTGCVNTAQAYYTVVIVHTLWP